MVFYLGGYVRINLSTQNFQFLPQVNGHPDPFDEIIPSSFPPALDWDSVYVPGLHAMTIHELVGYVNIRQKRGVYEEYEDIYSSEADQASGHIQTDHINASFMDSDKQKNAYIEGPLENICRDFWLMVWEQKVLVTVMTTQSGRNVRAVRNQQSLAVSSMGTRSKGQCPEQPPIIVHCSMGIGQTVISLNTTKTTELPYIYTIHSLSPYSSRRPPDSRVFNHQSAETNTEKEHQSAVTKHSQPPQRRRTTMQEQKQQRISHDHLAVAQAVATSTSTVRLRQSHTCGQKIKDAGKATWVPGQQGDYKARVQPLILEHTPITQQELQQVELQL
ncbi:Tyrosine-protein phosphatase non-receptor type 9 [Fukomys damarensis]|uniref:protein-tyrosine-phosphatase n=1 Tax=Fukomys damarensis TaxID=885580 RepID=A0A091CQQ2_FUKDA|nr:Tyrosine-protein phosphatase non-receptor type 9 [Fukomys damarensis]